jgi:iron complex transport system substrate-binding protein
VRALGFLLVGLWLSAGCDLEKKVIPENESRVSKESSSSLGNPEYKDFTQTGFTSEKPRHRIVTLAPALAEMTRDLLESSEAIVGVSEYSDYPPKGYPHAKSVGPYFRFHLEAVAALKPDLVVATLDGNDRAQVLRLREMGFSVVVLGSQSLAELKKSYWILGQVLNRKKRASEILQQFDSDLIKLIEKFKTFDRGATRVVLQIGDDPLVLIGGTGFVADVLKNIGVTNSLQDQNTAYPRLNYEEILRRNPDWILILTLGQDAKTYELFKKRWSRFSGLKAVKNGQVVVLKADELIRPTLRVIQGAELLLKTLTQSPAAVGRET